MRIKRIGIVIALGILSAMNAGIAAAANTESDPAAMEAKSKEVASSVSYMKGEMMRLLAEDYLKIGAIIGGIALVGVVIKKRIAPGTANEHEKKTD